MLSSTAANLYWIGRYMERAEFTCRLVEATLRLNALSDHAAGDQAWKSALSVVGASQAFAARGVGASAAGIRRFLTLSAGNSTSIRSCLASARDNARAARTALTVEGWEAINRAWLLIRDRTKPGGAQATLHLVDSLKAEIEDELRRQLDGLEPEEVAVLIFLQQRLNREAEEAAKAAA